MHVVTKILVVFCAVLSLLLAALTMAYAANAGELKASFNAERAGRLGAEADRSAGEAQWNSERANLEQRYEAAINAKKEADGLLATVQEERAQLRVSVEQAKAREETIANQVIALGTTIAMQTEMQKKQQDEVGRLREEQLSSTRRETELVARLNELEGANEVLQQTARALREELTEAKSNASAARGGDSAAGKPFEHPGAPIYSRVVDIVSAPNGSELAVISEGANRDIKPNMKMNIVRGRDFIADLIIERVEPQRSIGRIVYLDPTKKVQLQDEVRSRLMQ